MFRHWDRVGTRFGFGCGWDRVPVYVQVYVPVQVPVSVQVQLSGRCVVAEEMADSWATSAGNGRFVVFWDVVAEEMPNSSATLQEMLQEMLQKMLQKTLLMYVIFGGEDVR